MKAQAQRENWSGRAFRLLAAATLVAGAAVGCTQNTSTVQTPNAQTGGTATSGTAGGKKRVFGVSFQTMNNPFFVSLNKGLKDTIEARGDTLLTLDAQFDSLKQKNDISDLVLKKPAAIFINPVNWQGIKGSLLQAKGKSVPAVVIDAPVEDQSLVLATVASDNVKAGQLAAQSLVDAKRSGKVVILHLSINKACIDRVAGFKAELAKHPELKIVDIQEGKGTTEGGRPVMRDLIGRYPDLNAVFAINDPSALGAISALESAGKLKNVAVVSVDGADEAIQAIKAGKLLSTSAQFPEEIGKAAAEQVYNQLDGKPVEKDVKVRVELITAKNADTFMKKG